jgi:hypothetical protein
LSSGELAAAEEEEYLLEEVEAVPRSNSLNILVVLIMALVSFPSILDRFTE